MAVSSPARWRRLRIHPGTALGLFGALLFLGIWRGITVALEMQTGGSSIPWSRPLMWEITGTLAAWAVLWIPMTVALNAPQPAGRWARFLALHGAGWLAYWALKSFLMLSPRFLLYPRLGWGAYGYPDWPRHLAMEAMKDGASYALIAAGFVLYRAWRARQADQLRQAQLAAELREAQLRQLTGQLDPHFLFNALNTVSAVMYEDLARTDALLSDLGQLLRAGLERRGPTWTLSEEGDYLRRYGALLLARFGERLGLAVDLDGVPARALVPCFALQRLVENAVKHNQDRPGALAITVVAKAEEGRLHLAVGDDGGGFADPVAALNAAGQGLRGLAELLRLLHGEEASLELGRSSAGGAEVRVSLPLETLP